MIELLTAAKKGESDKTYSFFLSGDLSQMATQRTFLNEHGVTTKQNNVYPCLKECDVEIALKLIWENRVDGYWHYEDRYIKHGICTKEEFRER